MLRQYPTREMGTARTGQMTLSSWTTGRIDHSQQADLHISSSRSSEEEEEEEQEEQQQQERHNIK
jgi:hypothetical protein